MSTETEEASTDAPRRPPFTLDLPALSNAVLDIATKVVRALSLIFAGFLVAHVVLTVSRANPTNAITVFFRDAAAGLTLGVGDLFVPESADLRLVLNLGLAAVLWIVIGLVVAKVLTSLAPGSGAE